MAKLKTGDIVSCAVRSGVIVSSYGKYDEIRSFVIVAVCDNYGYYLYVPYLERLNNSEKADEYKCKSLNIDVKYLDEQIVYVTSSLIASVVFRDDSLKCKKCKQPFTYAEPNQPDGTFICYGCRQNPYL
jgi:hypothetical protein